MLTILIFVVCTGLGFMGGALIAHLTHANKGRIKRKSRHKS
jgi:hypothetical protein